MDTLNLFASDSLPASPADVTAPETDQIGDQSGPEVAALKRATGVYNCAWSLLPALPMKIPISTQLSASPVPPLTTIGISEFTLSVTVPMLLPEF